MMTAGNPFATSHEVTARTLLDGLRQVPDKRLLFVTDGRPIRPGYHVTEVKFGRFSALDCGANPEAWSETFIQLWDVDEPPRMHMAVGKFVAIIDKVAQLAPFDPDTKLTFEFSDGVEAIRLLQAVNLSESADSVTVTLGNRPASCKPRDRWLAEQTAVSCCPGTKQVCCGTAP
jgi:Family of unknown function (DUF6428)